MKKFFVAGLTAFLALFTAACSVTPMFYMPAEEGDISKIPVDGLTGFWEDTAKHTTVEIRPLDKNMDVDFPHGFDVTWMLRDVESKPEMKKVSLIALPREYHNERFMVCFLNTPKMLNEAKGYSAINLLMVRPNIYLVKFDLNEKKDELTVQVVTFNKKEDNSKPFHPDIKLAESVVMNSGKDMVRIINEKKYRFDESLKFVFKKKN